MLFDAQVILYALFAVMSAVSRLVSGVWCLSSGVRRPLFHSMFGVRCPAQRGINWMLAPRFAGFDVYYDSGKAGSASFTNSRNSALLRPLGMG